MRFRILLGIVFLCAGITGFAGVAYLLDSYHEMVNMALAQKREPLHSFFQASLGFFKWVFTNWFLASIFVTGVSVFLGLLYAGISLLSQEQAKS